MHAHALLMAQETIDVVKEAFPALREYPDDRITFYILTDAEGSRKSWSRLLDDGWVDIVSNPPPSMQVKVEDGPGDARKREWRIILATPN